MVDKAHASSDISVVNHAPVPSVSEETVVLSHGIRFFSVILSSRMRRREGLDLLSPYSLNSSYRHTLVPIGVCYWTPKRDDLESKGVQKV